MACFSTRSGRTTGYSRTLVARAPKGAKASHSLKHCCRLFPFGNIGCAFSRGSGFDIRRISFLGTPKHPRQPWGLSEVISLALARRKRYARNPGGNYMASITVTIERQKALSIRNRAEISLLRWSNIFPKTTLRAETRYPRKTTWQITKKPTLVLKKPFENCHRGGPKGGKWHDVIGPRISEPLHPTRLLIRSA